MRLLIAGAVVILAGCSSIEYPDPTQSSLTNSHVLTTTAGQGQIYVLSRNSSHYLCSLPHPDAAFDQADGGNVDVSIISSRSEDAGMDDSTEEVELAGRTPAVLMTRELFFRACEFSSNYQLSKDEAKELYYKTLEGALQNWAIEAGHTTVAIGDSVRTDSDVSNGSKDEKSNEHHLDDTSSTSKDEPQGY